MTMGLARQLLRPAARLAAAHAGAQLRRFLRVHARSRQVQDDLLRRLVAEHVPTRFGKAHGLAAVRTYNDFRKALPLNDYESLRPYLRAVYEGDTQALFPHGTEVMMFALTSGTTGEPKRIPVTRDGLASLRRGWNIFGLKALNDHPQAWLRKILQVSSPPAESFSPTGLPCGAISGLLAETQKRIVRRMYPVPREVLGIEDATSRYYAIMRVAIPEDVAIISTANPSTIVQLFAAAQENVECLLRDLRDGELRPPGEMPGGLRGSLRLRKHPHLVRNIERQMARDGRLMAKHFWNLSLLMHWTGGTLGLYSPLVRAVTGDVPVRDIGLLASEGRFSIPLEDSTPAGVADVTSAFLEFIPADEKEESSPPVLRSHEVAVGEEYFLVLTNSFGLWRYDIQDRIRVTDKVGETPVFEFLSKGRHTVSMTGEKLTEHQFLEAVRHAGESLGFHCARFVAQPHFAVPPYYALTVEAEADPPPGLVDMVDEILRAMNVEYGGKRATGRIGPIRLGYADKSSFDLRERRIAASRRGRQEQYKHQYLLTDVLNDTAAANG